MKTNKTVQELIEFRTEYGLSRALMSGMFGISRFTLRNWEQGVRTPINPGLIDKILKLVELDPKRNIQFLKDNA